MQKIISYKYYLVIPIVIFLLGLSVIIGWHTNNARIIQISPEFVPMQYNTALAFCLIGIGLIFSILQRNFISSIISILIMLIAGGTLVQYLFNLDLGLDQLFFKHYITTKTYFVGRMAPNTAICFVFSSLILFLVHYIQFFKYEKLTYFALVLSFLSTAISSVSFLGYIFNISDTYNWGAYTSMGFHTCIAFLLWNFGFIIWYKKIANQFLSKKNWLAVSLVFTIVVFVFLVLSQFLAKKEYKELIEAKTTFEEHIVKNFKEIIKLKIEVVELVALRLQSQINKTNNLRDTELNFNWDGIDSIDTFGLLDHQFNHVFIKNNIKNIKYPSKTEFSVFEINITQLSEPIYTNNQETGFWIVTPIFNNNKKVIGYFASLLKYSDIFNLIVSQRAKSLYQIKLTNNGKLAYINKVSEKADLSDAILSRNIPIKIHNQQLTMVLMPTNKLIARYKTIVPGILLIVGIVISFLIYLLVNTLIAIQNKSRQINLLFSATKSISESKTLEEAIKSCICNICEIIKWDVGHAYFISKNAPYKLIPSDIWHYNDEMKYKDFCKITKKTEFSSGQGLPGRVWESREVVWIDNVNNDDNFPRARKCNNLKIKSAIGLPIEVNNSVVVVLEFFNKHKIDYDFTLIQTMRILSKHISKAYEKKETENLLAKKTIELESINKKMLLLAYTDPLTQLLNRRSFEDEAMRILSYSRRHKTKTAIMYTDLDNFKSINDEFGHETGDLLLMAVANKIRNTVRTEDLVARFGGDEFVIFLSDIASFAEANNIALKIINKIAEPIVINHNKLSISISIGIKICSSDNSFSEIIREADKALYASKSTGKSKVCFG